jgi:hypothetical protein
VVSRGTPFAISLSNAGAGKLGGKLRGSGSYIRWAHALGVCLAALVALVVIGKPGEQSRHAVKAPSTASSLAPTLPPGTKVKFVSRQLYPYSVIPGGVQNPQELKYDVAHDPVVASHYADFNIAKAHVEHLNQDELAYVSYRIGDHVFWTNKKLRLAKGETVITDGTNVARTRCGNRVSMLPLLPVSPEQPAPRDIEAPPAPDIVAILLPPPVIPEIPPVPPGPVTPPAAPPSTPPGGFIIPPPVLPPFGGPVPTPGTPPISVPEPGADEMLFVGLAAAIAARSLFTLRGKKKS